MTHSSPSPSPSPSDPVSHSRQICSWGRSSMVRKSRATWSPVAYPSMPSCRRVDVAFVCLCDPLDERAKQASIRRDDHPRHDDDDDCPDDRDDYHPLVVDDRGLPSPPPLLRILPETTDRRRSRDDGRPPPLSRCFRPPSPSPPPPPPVRRGRPARAIVRRGNVRSLATISPRRARG